MRLNKFLANNGVTSRRKADELIESGKVSVNNKIITELGFNIDETQDTVYVNGKKVNYYKQAVYLMLYKPKGCVTAVSDDKGRKTVMDYVPLKYKNLVKPVGRLDYDSEGLLILTNDGDFANKITHPSNQTPKTYIVKIEGNLTNAELKKISNGVELEKGVITAPAKISILQETDKFTRLEIVITEGKNREIRRIFESINKTVTFLKRTQIGLLRLGGLTRGTTKEFNPKYALASTSSEFLKQNKKQYKK